MTLVFHIGPAGLAQDWLAETFRRNGHVALNWLRGQLAGELAFARLDGTPVGRGSAIPELAGFPDGQVPALIAGLDGPPQPWRPALDMTRHFRAFRRWFPDAVFLLPRRNDDDWIAARLALRDGGFARSEALRRGLDLGDLPAIWRAERAAHEADAAQFFGASPRFLRPDLDAGAGALADALAPFVALPRRAPEREDKAPVAIAMPPRLRPAPRDPGFVAALTAFCLGQSGQGQELQGCSALYGRWDGARRVTRRDGS